MQHDQLFLAVYHALDWQHCAVCHLSVQGVERLIDGFLYERVNDPWTREDLLASRGFCAAHAWRLTHILDSQTGIAIVYRHLLQEFYDTFITEAAGRVSQPVGLRLALFGGSNGGLGRSLSAWLTPQRPCLACADQWQAEERYTWATAQALPDEDFRARYASSLGLCLRHLATVMTQTESSSDLEWLTNAERALLEGLLNDLSEFWRKHDYRFRHEPMSQGEATSWQRVLHKYVGAPGVVWRW
ncbi:MAG: DUF6062 family protein [Armatimonadota bacterium]|nr:DUF6062 family protein [Armatimonadota bacterium]